MTFKQSYGCGIFCLEILKLLRYSLTLEVVCVKESLPKILSDQCIYKELLGWIKQCILPLLMHMDYGQDII